MAKEHIYHTSKPDNMLQSSGLGVNRDDDLGSRLNRPSRHAPTSQRSHGEMAPLSMKDILRVLPCKETLIYDSGASKYIHSGPVKRWKRLRSMPTRYVSCRSWAQGLLTTVAACGRASRSPPRPSIFTAYPAFLRYKDAY